MQFTSSPRRALGLLAVGTIGMSTAVLGVTGVAQAAPLAPITFTAADSPLTIPAGYCTVDWKLVGGSGGAAEDGTPGVRGGELAITTDVRKADTFTLFPGTAGSVGAGGVGGAGGTNADGQWNGGLDGTTPDPAGPGGGGGGAATTVQNGGYPFLFAFGGNGGRADIPTSQGLGQGNGENRTNSAVVNSTVTTAPLGDGSVSGTVRPCVPGTPTVNWIAGGEKSATLQIWRGMIPEGSSIPVYEYSLNNGDWKTLVSGNEFQYEPTITGLVYGTKYSVRVRTTTDGGSSEPTVAQTVTPTIGAPTNLKATAGPGSITITWAPPADPAEAADVKGYEAWALPGAAPQSSQGLVECAAMDASARSCTIGVPVGSEYTVGVRAMGPEAYSTGAFVVSAKVGDAVVSPEAPKSSGALSTDKGAVSTVAVGGTVTLTGGGYQPFSTVTLVMYSTPIVLGTTVADAGGNISATVTLPAGMSGTHTLVASGVDPSGAPHNLTMAVTVGSAGEGGLPNTGADIALPALGGLVALAAGGGLLFAARRRAAA
ncbi:MAG TPA: fibronectin type III domain-containing protein [Blastococcus sp.]